jgi:hypothetical protein
VFGTLSVAVGARAGDLSAGDATTTYYWNPLWNLAALSPWLLLAGLMLLPPNRHRGALPVLLPVLVVFLGVEAVLSLFPFSLYNSLFSFAGCLSANAFGLAALMLVSHWFEGRSSRSVFLLAMLIALVVAITAELVMPGGGPDSEAFTSSLGLAIIVVVQVVGMALAARRIRNGTSGGQYAWRVFVGVLLACEFVCLLLFAMTAALSYSGTAGETLAFVPQVVIIAGVLSVVTYLVLLPFLVVLFRAPFYRDRFFSVLDVRPQEDVEP